MPTPSPNVRPAAQLLAEARALLDRRPAGDEPIGRASMRIIEAQWLIAEADWQRASAALDAQIRLDVEQRPVYQAEPLTPERREQFAELAEHAQAGAHQRDETGRLIPVDACPSRFLDADGQRIVHCAVRHAVPQPEHHAAAPFWWSDAGALPADRPCDKRCARCVERVRDNLLRRVVQWNDHETPITKGTLSGAIDAYRKVMEL